MTSFQDEYKQKLTSPEEAVKVVKSGDWVEYSHGLGIPKALDEALANRASELEDINIRGFLVFHPLKIYEANEKEGRQVFTFNSWYYGGFDRKETKKGHTIHIPMRYAEQPLMYAHDIEEVNVLMVQVTPMDKFGYFNLGPASSSVREIIKRADHIILEVNENLPYVQDLYGGTVHISEVDAVIEAATKVDATQSAEPSDVDQKIAENLLPLIPNGATLQLGIGGMPNALGGLIAEAGLQDLGVHSEMYMDGFMKMTKAGSINGKKKGTDKGKQVFTFAVGSEELYEFMDHNPELATAPVNYVNSPAVCASNENFISINNAVNFDIMGQVSAESSGFKQISGTGGQLDFVIGAYNSPGGKSILALASTYEDKEGNLQSNIVTHLKPGTVVTTPRTATHYLATEYGVFNVRGKSLWERAEGIIGLAHPKVRDQLIKEAEEVGLWRPSNKR